MNDPEIHLIDLSDEQAREAALKMALSMYIGETCPYCKRKFETLQDLETAVYNGYTKYGRIAHRACFDEAHKGAA